MTDIHYSAGQSCDTTAMERRRFVCSLLWMLAASARAEEAWMVPNELPPAPHSPPVEGCGPAPEPNAQPRERLPRPTECSVSLDAEARAACMLALSAVATDGELLLLAASADHLDGLEPSLTAARSAVGGQLLIVATDEIARARADALGIAWWYLPTPSVHLPATHWRAAALLLRNGISVLVSSPAVRWHSNPFSHLSRDVDVEVVQLGGMYERGAVESVHDPPMGWSAYAQTMAQPLLDASLVALHASSPSAELASAFGVLLGSSAVEVAADEGWMSWTLSTLVLQPAHDAISRAGVSFRLLRSDCYLGSERDAAAVVATRVSEAAQAGAAAEALIPTNTGNVNSILSSTHFGYARAIVLESGCAVQPAAAESGAAAARAPNWVLPPAEVFPGPPSACEASENSRALCATLEAHALGREVLAAVSNKNILPMLELFVEGTTPP